MFTYEFDHPGRKPIDTALPAPATETVVYVAKAQETPVSKDVQPDPGPAPACL